MMSSLKYLAGAVVLLLVLSVAAPAQTPAPVDRWGDSLPDGAVLRLGTIRMRHGAEVTDLVFLPDSHTIASAGFDGVVRFWDIETGRELREFTGHPNGIEPSDRGVHALVLLKDGKTMLSAGSHGKPLLWDVETCGKAVAAGIRCAMDSGSRLSPDGALLATVNHGTTAIFDLASQTERGRFKAHDGLGGAVCWSADGTKLFTVGGKDGLKCWSLEGELNWEVPQSKMGVLVAASPDGRFIAAGDWEGGLRLLRATDGSTVTDLPGGNLTDQALLFSPDGASLVVGAGDGEVRVLRIPDGACVGIVGAHRGRVSAMAFSPDGKKFATGGWDHRIRVWEWPSLRETISFPAHAGGVSSVAVSPDGKRIATAASDCVRIWDSATGAEQQLKAENPKAVRFSLDGKQLYAGCAESLHSWDLPAGTEILHRELKREGIAWAFGFAGRAERCAFPWWSGGRGNVSTVRVWDYDRGVEVASISTDSPSTDIVALSPDGATVAFASSWEVHLFGLPEGEKSGMFSVPGVEIFPIHARKETVRALAFSNHGDLLALGTRTGRIRIVDLAAGRFIRDIKAHKSWITTLAFSPDDRAIASSGWDDSVKVWEVATDGLIFDFSGQRGWGECLAWFPDGTRLVSGGADCTALVWDLAAPLPGMGGTPAELWSTLADPDPRRAWAAACKLERLEPGWVDVLGKIALEQNGLDAATAAAVEKLDDGEPEVRERATADIEALGADAEPALRRALKLNSLGPEGAARAESLIAGLPKTGYGPQTVRMRRFIALLERQGDDPALATINALWLHAPWFRTRIEAAEALERLRR